MSNRERWTVYPLIFLALGVALRDKITGSITCESFVIAARDGQPRLRCFMNNQAGGIVLYGQHGKPTMTMTANDDRSSGKLIVFSPDGHPQVIVQSDADSGSSIILHGSNHEPRIVMHGGRGPGTLETLNAAGTPQVILGASKKGGLVSAIDNERTFIISLGHEASASGIFGTNTRQGQTLVFPLTSGVPLQHSPDPHSPDPQPNRGGEGGDSHGKPPGRPAKEGTESSPIERAPPT